MGLDALVQMEKQTITANLLAIIEGWKGVMSGKGFNIAEAQRRATICASCPHVRIPLQIPICSKCGCPLSAKTKSMKSSCPINNWGPYNEE